MFAIAIHDIRRGRVLLARDHVGIKPLYVARTASGVVFGSEIKVLLASGWVEPRADLDALGQFLSWEYVPGTRTLFRSIDRLAAGGMLDIDLASGRIWNSSFWTVPARFDAGPESDRHRTEDDWADEVDDVVRRAVRRQMVSDVPLGAFLSGGVDSSLVAAAMGSAHTFSVGFDDPSYNETAWSAEVARHLGVTHEIEVIRPDAHDLFDKLMHFMDDPIGDFSIFPTYLVSRLARRHVKVSLSGDGGDEIFGGYETFLAQEKDRLWRRLPAFIRDGVIPAVADRLRPTAAKKGLVNKVKRFVEGARLDPRLGHARWRLFAEGAFRDALFTPQARAAVRTPAAEHILSIAEECQHLDHRRRMLYVDFRSYLVDNCLAKVDRMSMACSLEARVPLLDREVIDVAFRLPPDLLLRGGDTKVLLKKVAARHVPARCVYRPKQGFSIPIKNWLRTDFAPLLERYLDPQRLRSGGIFDPETINRLRREHDDNRANHSHVLWSLLVFEHWRDRWGVSV
jgi:asparagine synthase (glutamine-hydrolysing)